MSTRKYPEDFINKVICGDCLEVMKDMPDGCVDLILTDPPYSVISGGNRKGLTRRWKNSILEKNDGRIFNHNDVEPRKYLIELYRVLKENSHIYIMVNFLNLSYMMTEMKLANFKLHNLLVWNKNNSTPNRWYMKNIEYTIFARKGKAKSINKMESKTSHYFKNPTHKFHPTEKPAGLMNLYIFNSSREGELVFDPFIGSGTTSIACRNLNRNFIGIEINPEYCKIAEERLAQGVL